MEQISRIYFTSKQKSEIWDRWQRGESMSSIGRLFDRDSSSIYPLLSRTDGCKLLCAPSSSVLFNAELVPLEPLIANSGHRANPVLPKSLIAHHQAMKLACSSLTFLP